MYLVIYTNTFPVLWTGTANDNLTLKFLQFSYNYSKVQASPSFQLKLLFSNSKANFGEVFIAFCDLSSSLRDPPVFLNRGLVLLTLQCRDPDEVPSAIGTFFPFILFKYNRNAFTKKALVINSHM